MAKLPRVSGRECGKALEKVGFYLKRWGKGDHMIFRRDNPFAQVTIPDHAELDRGTLKAILNGASLTVDEFVELL